MFASDARSVHPRRKAISMHSRCHQLLATCGVWALILPFFLGAPSLSAQESLQDSSFGGSGNAKASTIRPAEHRVRRSDQPRKSRTTRKSVGQRTKTVASSVERPLWEPHRPRPTAKTAAFATDPGRARSLQQVVYDQVSSRVSRSPQEPTADGQMHPVQTGQPTPAVIREDPKLSVIQRSTTEQIKPADAEHAPRVATAPTWSPARGIPARKKAARSLFADPEQFRIISQSLGTPATGSRDAGSGNQLGLGKSPSGGSGTRQLRLPPISDEVVRANRGSSRGGSGGKDFLDNLPSVNLRGGIAANSLQRTLVNRAVADPNHSFAFAPDAMLAPDYRAEAVPLVKTWRSPDLVHQPLYFEDVNLERYGNGHAKLQPFLSGAHFFTSVFLLPYKTGVNHPTDCEYSLGAYRPGDCNPAYRDCPPFNRRAALKQVLVTGGLWVGL